MLKLLRLKLTRKKYIIFFFSLFSFLFQNEVAIVTKNNGDVKYKKESSKRFTNRINSGLELFNNDLLVTGNDGFIMFAYLDDGSLIKVHKDSEVLVDGNLNNNTINKQVIINDGFIKFDIKKQKQNEFKVVTPTSVASVKGTLFYVDTSPLGDVFYGFEGLVEVLNIESQQVSSLSKSKKITSSSDGSIEVEEIVDEDIEYIVQVQQESGIQIEEIEELEEINNPGQGIEEEGNDGDDNESGEPDDSGTGDAATGNEIQEVVITFTNENGEQKTLTIKFIEQ